MKKLHLGSGGLHLDGYINTDYDDLPGVDLVLDAASIPYPFDDNVLDEIVNAHMIEHIEYDLVLPMVQEWYRVLKPGASVYVDCPDFLAATQLYEQGEIAKANEIIFGNNERPTQHHRAGWTYQTLKDIFTRAGFPTIEEQDSTDYHLVNCGIPTFRLHACK